ncbi:MAG TPA: SdrD B-like domain-containing protein, partial [Humisphaera sp.]
MSYPRSRRRVAAAPSLRPGTSRPSTNRPAAARPNAVAEPLEGRRLLSDVPAPLGSVAGAVFVDTNRDGAYQFGETGVTGTAYLDANGNAALDASELSAPAGASFVIRDVPAGHYTVRLADVVTEPGASLTVPTGDASYEVDVAEGQAVTGINFGFDTAAPAIYGRVFDDLDRDGVRDANERGAFSAQLFVDLNGNGVRDGAERSSFTTITDGYYEFRDLPAGTFSLRLDGTYVRRTTQLPDWEGIPFTVGADEVVQMPDIGTTRALGKWVTGTVYEDWNGSGTRDAGDVPASQARAYLDLNGNAKLDVSEPSGFTFSTGQFTLPSSVPPGNYLLRVGPGFTPSATTWTVTGPGPVTVPGARVITVPPSNDPAPAADASVLVQVTAPNRIVGAVYEDADEDRVHDPGEAGTVGSTVFLDRDLDGVLDEYERRTVTAPDGSYAFENVADGSAYVVLVPPPGRAQLTPSPSSFGESTYVSAGRREARIDYGTVPIFVPAADQSAVEGAATSFALGGTVMPATRSMAPLATIDWGDGTPAESTSVSPFTGRRGAIFPRSHAYADDGVYTVTLTVKNLFGGAVLATGSFRVTVANLPPVAAVTAPAVANERTPVTVGLSASDPSPTGSIARWVVDFGDGSATVELPGDATAATHSYPVGGATYTV